MMTEKEILALYTLSNQSSTEYERLQASKELSNEQALEVVSNFLRRVAGGGLESNSIAFKNVALNTLLAVSLICVHTYDQFNGDSHAVLDAIIRETFRRNAN